jgi:hypothetical protein
MAFRTNLTVATLLAASTLTLSSPPAVAQIVCNERGECWRAHGHYGYRPEWGYMHPHHWHGGEEWRHGWHEHEGNDYRRGGGNGYWDRRHGDEQD